jgi:hypothetical protein
MSTVTLNYSDVTRARRVPAIGQILIVSSVALIGITLLLTVISANTDLAHRAAVSQNSVVPLPVPVATPPAAAIRSMPSETPVSTSALASGTSALPISVPTPPSQ